MKKIIYILILFSIQNSYSQEIELFCNGTNKGTDIRMSKYEFPMKVNFSIPDFYGIRSVLVPSCLQFNPQKPPITPKCNVNINEMNCSCVNSQGTTSIILSRITGRLSIQTFFFDKAYWEGEFFCEKITGRKF